MPDNKRHFIVQGSSIGFEGGLYRGKTPKQAAQKAANKLFRKVEKDAHYRIHKNRKSIKFILRESTKGSDRKVQYYEAVKKKLDEPIVRVIKRDGVETEVKYHHKITVSSCDAF